MEQWVAQRTVRHGAEPKPAMSRLRAGFALADFGLAEAGIMAHPVFRRYCDQYGVRCC